jgi:hypothetical protein
MSRNFPCLLSGAFLAFIAAPAMPQASGMGSSASISIGSGPQAGKYDYAPREACAIAAFGDQPLGLLVVLSSDNSSLSLDMPNLDEKHANEIHIVLVVAERKMGAGTKGAASTTYEIDTRPEAALKPFQKAERANKGITGKATTTLTTQGNNVLLSFSGETATGVKLNGEVTCRKVVS